MLPSPPYIEDTGRDTDILRELARAKVAFQLRTIRLAMGLNDQLDSPPHGSTDADCSKTGAVDPFNHAGEIRRA